MLKSIGRLSWRTRLVLTTVLVLIVVGGSWFGYRTWYNSAHYVSTNNAKVVADLIQVGSINAGRILEMNVDVGAPVIQGQVIAMVDIPTVISGSSTTDTHKLGFRDVQDQFAEVIAPASGIVAARWSKVGDTVPPGQPIVTLMQPRNVWVVANINENSVRRVLPGQRVEVHVDSLGRSVDGTVDTVSPVTAGTFSLLPSRNASGNFTKVSQLVPVKIAVNHENVRLIPGSSVEVKIRVR
jgi:multidrug resistance efflux pump